MRTTDAAMKMAVLVDSLYCAPYAEREDTAHKLRRIADAMNHSIGSGWSREDATRADLTASTLRNIANDLENSAEQDRILEEANAATG